MPTALVTGAAGFTGKYVVNALTRRGYRVIGIGLGDPSGSDWLACDLTDKAGAKKSLSGIAPDVVVHLAALAFVGEGNPENFYRVNVLGTTNLLEVLADTDRTPARILIASSANAYGNISGSELSEDICPAPVNHYAASKLAMEHMVRTWFDRLPIIMTRPFNYTGPGQDERFVVPKIVNHYKRKASSIKLGDTGVERDFSDVEDVVEAYMRLLESDVRSEVVNICSGKPVSVAAIVAEMNSIAGYEIKVETQQELLRKNDIHRLIGNNQKLRRLTGFAPSIGIRETLQRMYDA
jgi:nucleoside-diphosphate-sugar epimerase